MFGLRAERKVFKLSPYSNLNEDFDAYVTWCCICVQPSCHVSVVAAPIGAQHSIVCPNKAMETAADTLPSRPLVLDQSQVTVCVCKLVPRSHDCRVGSYSLEALQYSCVRILSFINLPLFPHIEAVP